MEQSLGKRIMQHRKRMGLTQEQLAEQLGITAQAVSKWENDLSCPDITALPKLAEIFGITTDELLGKQSETRVYEGEVTNSHASSVHWENDNDKWEFRWNSGRKHALTYALWVLLTGVLYLASRLLDWDASLWDILWPTGLIMFGVNTLLSRFSFLGLGCVLFGGFFLINNLGVVELPLDRGLLLPIVIVLFGCNLLADALRKPKKPKLVINKNGSTTEKTKWECRNHTGGFECDLSFGERTFLVEVPCLAEGDANVSFGELTVDLSAVGSVSSDCTIDASCSFGALNLLVPRRFAVQADNSTAFASVNFIGHPDSTPEGVIHLDASASFGEICVRYL